MTTPFSKLVRTNRIMNKKSVLVQLVEYQCGHCQVALLWSAGKKDLKTDPRMGLV